MLEILKEINKEKIMISLLYIIIGSFLFIYPKLSIDIIMISISLLLIVYGIFHLIIYLRSENIGLYNRLELITSIIALATSIFILFNSKIVISIIPFIIGVFIIIEAGTLIKHATILRNYDHKSFQISLVLGIILFIIGAYLLFNPIEIITSLMTFIGVILICMGLFELWTFYQLQKYMHHLN